MKAKIVYFSQTGNTRKVCEAIAAGIVESQNEVVLERLQDTDSRWLADADLMGIGTPVFYYKQPFNVTDFLKGLTGLEGKHAFVFITEGGHQSNTLLRIKTLLARKGVTTIGCFSSLGYDTFPIYIGKDRQKGHPDGEDLKAAKEFGRDLFSRLDSIRGGRTDLLPILEKKWDRFHRLSILLSKGVLKAVFPKKNLDRGKCTGCGRCVHECPVGAIEMKEYPVFNDKCIYCYLCQRICPEEAIICDCRFVSKFVKD